MLYQYKLLKEGVGWGIAVYLDMSEVEAAAVKEFTQIHSNIFMKCANHVEFKKDIIFFWARQVFNEVGEKVIVESGKKRIFFLINSIDVNFTQFQEEGLYLAFRGWLEEYYCIKFPEIRAEFDKRKRKYIFPELKIDDISE